MGNFAKNSVFFMRVYPGILSILLVLVSACNRQYDARLTDIETYINDRPDSALAVVTAIDPADLHTRRDKALHSLVYSMALDKCYIDTTDVSVVQPAFDYFRHHGSADYRLKAVYYRARIAENAGDIDLAKEILVRYGDRYVDKAQDLSFAGKYLLKHSEFSRFVFDYETSIQYAQLAKQKYEQISEVRGLATACFGIISSYICLGNYDAAQPFLLEVKEILDFVDIYRKCLYYKESILLAIYTDKLDIAETLSNECTEVCKGSRYIPLSEIMEVFLKRGKIDEAYDAMIRMNDLQGVYDDGHIIIRQSELYAARGEYEKAYELEHEVFDIIWKDDKRAIESDIRNIETRVLAEVSKVKMRYSIWILGIASMAIMSLAAYLLYVLHKRKQHAAALYNELEKERDELLTLKNSVIVDKETRDVIDDRVKLINGMLLEKMSGNIIIKKDNIRRMDRIIQNRQSFLSSISVLFSICHPRFITHLRNNGLSDVEIGYCCLLVQGFSAKEMASIFDMPRFYKLTGAIRTKLSMAPYEKHLKNHLISLLSMDNPD